MKQTLSTAKHSFFLSLLLYSHFFTFQYTSISKYIMKHIVFHTWKCLSKSVKKYGINTQVLYQHTIERLCSKQKWWVYIWLEIISKVFLWLLFYKQKKLLLVKWTLLSYFVPLYIKLISYVILKYNNISMKNMIWKASSQVLKASFMLTLKSFARQYT